MRIIFYTGKGGVGKTSISCATGLRLAEAGYKTLVLSLDIAHSVADSFDIPRRLLDKHEGRPLQIGERLFIQEIDIQAELSRWWNEIYKYVSMLLNTTGLEGVVADELAVMPGMEEVSLLLYINQYCQEREFEVLILDCAPTGESLRFISVPTALDWYMKKIFKAERLFLRAARPVWKVINRSIPLPEDEYFAALERLSQKLEGVAALLHDPETTTVRLVTLPEKMVIKESQRAFMYFSLYGLVTDAVIVNRLIPEWCQDPFLAEWKRTQVDYLAEIRGHFAPVPLWTVEMFREEVVGLEGLRRLGAALYSDIDPYRIYYKEQPYRFVKKDGRLELALRLPWLTKGDLEISKVGHELVINVSGFKKHVELPRSFAGAKPVGAKIKGDYVTISFQEER